MLAIVDGNDMSCRAKRGYIGWKDWNRNFGEASALISAWGQYRIIAAIMRAK